MEYSFCQQSALVEKEPFPVLVGLMLGHHAIIEQLPNGPIIISEDLLQDVRCMLPEQGRWPGL